MFKAFEFIVAGIIGYVIYYLGIKFENSSNSYLITSLSIVISLLLALIFLFLSELRMMKKSISKMSNDISINNSLYEKLIESLINNNQINSLSLTVAKYTSSFIKKADMPKTWEDLSWNIKGSYYATNYINPKDLYDQKWAQSTLTIQQAKEQTEGTDIKKVFIVDEEKEINELKEVLLMHKNNGITIRYILYQKIINSDKLRPFLEKTPSIDFGIFNNEIVLIWALNKKREFDGGFIYNASEKCQHYEKFFKNLFHEAEEISF